MTEYKSDFRQRSAQPWRDYIHHRLGFAVSDRTHMVRIVFNQHFFVGFISNAAGDCAIAR